MLTPERFAVFSPPIAASIEIDIAPRLESWMQHDHPDQVRLRAYLDWLEPRVKHMLAENANSLELTVALAEPLPLDAGGGDLDNFLFPVVRRLGHQRFVSVWGRKVRGARSSIAVGPALPAPLPDETWRFAAAETSQPKDTSAWKREIDAQVRAQVHHAEDGALEIQIAYLVDPVWNWSVLWKPTIDALGGIVGDGARPFHPLDDRIVRLGLHRRTESRRSPRSASIGVWWRRVS